MVKLLSQGIENTDNDFLKEGSSYTYDDYPLYYTLTKGEINNHLKIEESFTISSEIISVYIKRNSTYFAFPAVKNGSKFYFSQDGLTWQSTTVSSNAVTPIGIAYGNGWWVVIGYNSNNYSYIWYSQDLINFTEKQVTTTSAAIFNDIIFHDNAFVISGGKHTGDGTCAGYICYATCSTSSPPISWTLNKVSSTYYLSRIMYAENNYVCLGLDNLDSSSAAAQGLRPAMIYSPSYSNTSWTTYKTPWNSYSHPHWTNDFCYDGNKYYMTIHPNYGDAHYLLSADSFNGTWTSHSLPHTSVDSKIFSLGEYLIAFSVETSDQKIYYRKKTDTTWIDSGLTFYCRSNSCIDTDRFILVQQNSSNSYPTYMYVLNGYGGFLPKNSFTGIDCYIKLK